MIAYELYFVGLLFLCLLSVFGGKIVEHLYLYSVRYMAHLDAHWFFAWFYRTAVALLAKVKIS